MMSEGQEMGEMGAVRRGGERGGVVPRVHVVTGTDTDVGKTWATAAVAAEQLAWGLRVHVDKPVQTGLAPGEPGDVDVVAELLGRPEGLSVSEGVRLPAAMAPVDAVAEVDALVEAGAKSGVVPGVLPGLEWHVARWRRHLEEADVLVIEGAGGVTVALTEAGETPVQVVQRLRSEGWSAAVELATRPGLGTQNHTLLTWEHLTAHGVGADRLLICRTSAEPDPVEQANLRYLTRLAAGVAVGCIPEGRVEVIPAG